MRKINLEAIRSEFDLISDLIISIDEDEKVFLRHKAEIRKFIKTKSLTDQQLSVEQLIDLHEIGVISEEFLHATFY